MKGTSKKTFSSQVPFSSIDMNHDHNDNNNDDLNNKE